MKMGADLCPKNGGSCKDDGQNYVSMVLHRNTPPLGGE